MSKTYSTYNYFDLIDWVQEIQNPEVAAQAAQALAFRVDLLIQSNARSIFRALREEELNKLGAEMQTANARADLETLFRSVDFAEKTFSEYTDRVAGSVSTLKSLTAMRDKINDMARDLTALTIDWQGNPRVYEPANLDELFLARPDLRITETEQMRTRLTVEQLKAHGILDADADTEAFMKMEEDRRKDELHRMADTMHRQGPITLMFYEMALTCDGEPTEHFYELDLNVQRLCIDSVNKAIQRVMDRAKSDRRLSTVEFMALVGNSIASMKTLNDVLRSPRFSLRETV